MYAGSKCRHRIITNLAELEHQRITAQHHIVADGDMAGQRGVVGKNGVVTYHAVVRQMHIRHHPVVVANPRFTDASDRTQIKGDKFAYGIAVADDQLGRLSTVFFILRNRTQ